MRFGIHLAQFGRALTPDSIQRSARRAEELGYDDVWVSDHLVVPMGQAYPSPELADPLLALALAAASTSSVGIGTNVLVGPQYASPLQLANSLATLDHWFERTAHGGYRDRMVGIRVRSAGCCVLRPR